MDKFCYLDHSHRPYIDQIRREISHIEKLTINAYKEAYQAYEVNRARLIDKLSLEFSYVVHKTQFPELLEGDYYLSGIYWLSDQSYPNIQLDCTVSDIGMHLMKYYGAVEIEHAIMEKLNIVLIYQHYDYPNVIKTVIEPPLESRHAQLLAKRINLLWDTYRVYLHASWGLRQWKTVIDAFVQDSEPPRRSGHYATVYANSLL